jgi:hypothetical protein
MKTIGAAAAEGSSREFLHFQPRILYLCADPRRMRAQLAGERLTRTAAGPLRDDISTDEISPVPMLVHFDATLANTASWRTFRQREGGTATRASHGRVGRRWRALSVVKADSSARTSGSSTSTTRTWPVPSSLPFWTGAGLTRESADSCRECHCRPARVIRRDTARVNQIDREWSSASL